jgi:hypothetical protein
MNPDQETEQPVAYDVVGHPLYTHPADLSRSGAMVASQAVHMVQPGDEPFISDATKIKHDRSKQLYPTLNLSPDEYVIVSIRRHLIGLVAPFGIGILLIALAFSALFNFDIVVQVFQLSGSAANPTNAILPIILFVLLVALGSYAAYYIYINNKFYLTNESVIEVTQLSLFSHREQSISLANIEDASYTKNGVLQSLFDYGSIRLSTVGDMTAYKFSYVAQPKQNIDMINGALETYKANRPIKTEQ